MKISEIKQNYDDETVHTFEQVGYIIRHHIERYDHYVKMLADILEIPSGEAKQLAKNLATQSNKHSSRDNQRHAELSELVDTVNIHDIFNMLIHNEQILKDLLHEFHLYNQVLVPTSICRIHDDIFDNIKDISDHKLLQLLYAGTLDAWLERYFTKTEGSPMSGDKAAFAKSQLIKSYVEQHTQPLYTTYTDKELKRLPANTKPDEHTYWSAKSLETTDQLIAILKATLYL